MHYSKLMFALPVANALVARNEVAYAYTTEVSVETVVVTQTAGAPVVVTETAGAPAPPAATVSAVAYSQVQPHQGHAQFHSSAAAAKNSQPAQYTAPASSAAAPPASYAAPPPPPASPSAAPSSAPSSGGSSSSGGCPLDTSGQHTSPGVDGKPAKSMIDSINYMRRLYNPNANCLTWSDSLAGASDTCAAAQSESHLRMDSSIVSAPGYCTSSYYSGNLASSEYERSMIWMLCQAPNDPELKGTCSGKTAEAGCSSGACQGHHDAIVDADNKNKFMGCGASDATSWLSCSFSNTEDYQ